jgi:hypothetical protein
MYGVAQGITYNNIDRDEELNKRIEARNVPSRPLQPQFDIRPTPTKYTMFPMVTPKDPPCVKINREPIYNVEEVFNPGTAQAPWSGYIANINTESTLRNQFFALQKCEQSVYVPSTTSDMYTVKVSGRNETQPFPGLFAEQTFAPFDPNTGGVGKDIFNNNTRVQMLDGPPCYPSTRIT